MQLNLQLSTSSQVKLQQLVKEAAVELFLALRMHVVISVAIGAMLYLVLYHLIGFSAIHSVPVSSQLRSARIWLWSLHEQLWFLLFGAMSLGAGQLPVSAKRCGLDARSLLWRRTVQ